MQVPVSGRESDNAQPRHAMLSRRAAPALSAFRSAGRARCTVALAAGARLHNDHAGGRSGQAAWPRFGSADGRGRAWDVRLATGWGEIGVELRGLPRAVLWSTRSTQALMTVIATVGTTPFTTAISQPRDEWQSGRRFGRGSGAPESFCRWSPIGPQRPDTNRPSAGPCS